MLLHVFICFLFYNKYAYYRRNKKYTLENIYILFATHNTLNNKIKINKLFSILSF